MFKAFGHDDVAVLDGGLPKWAAEGRAVSNMPENSRERHFTPTFRPRMVRSADDLARAIDKGLDRAIGLKIDEARDFTVRRILKGAGTHGELQARRFKGKGDDLAAGDDHRRLKIIAAQSLIGTQGAARFQADEIAWVENRIRTDAISTHRDPGDVSGGDFLTRSNRAGQHGQIGCSEGPAGQANRLGTVIG